MSEVTAPYNGMPGWKVTDTSRAAAESVRHTTAEAYSGIMAVLRKHGPMTADEAASIMGLTPFYVRPRFSEMKEMGWIEPTGDKRKNNSRRAANVMRIVS